MLDVASFQCFSFVYSLHFHLLLLLKCPSFAADEVVDVVEAVLDVYREQRQNQETFTRTLSRVGFDVFKDAANAARNSTARTA